MALVLYGLLVTATALPASALPLQSATRALLMGAGFPGAGFLHWAASSQLQPAVLLFVAGTLAFLAALFLWFATGNIVAPVATWGGLAVLAAQPAMLGLDAAKAATWPSGLGSAVFLLLVLVWLGQGGRTSVDRQTFRTAAKVHEPSATPREGLSLETLQRLNLLLDRARQPVDRFDGFETRDQFQTGALRYQVNFMSYALSIAAWHHLPAARQPFATAQENLLTKVGDRRLWRYWRLENAWGNLRIDADPVPRQNIMYSGFVALQMALAGSDRLTLHTGGRLWRRYELGEIADLLERQYRASRFGLIACEPNWIYPLCNLITMAAVKAADARLGTDCWDRMASRFLECLQREGTRADGSFIAFRSALTGLAPPAPGGIVMQALPCLFLNALSPELAQDHWHRIRDRLDRGNWSRLFWPVDVGNYSFSRASSYTATAAAAVEMGDRQVAEECLRLLEQECPSRLVEGAIHRERASLWAHALELMARCGRKDGLRDLITGTPPSAGPRVLRLSCPKLHVASAVSDGSGVELILQPGCGEVSPLIEFGGLLPGRFYHTENCRWPLLKADAAGRGVLKVSLRDRTAVSIRLAAEGARTWSAA